MNKQSSKFFIIIGLLLIIGGIILMPDDEIIGIIGILFGSYNLFKGFRLSKGIQPYVYRKQKKMQKEVDDDLKNEFHKKK